MDEYLKINWRENILDTNTSFVSLEDLSSSRINQFLKGKLDCVSARNSLIRDAKNCKIVIKLPGERYKYPGVFKSRLTKDEHLSLIRAIKLLESGRTLYNKYELKDIQFQNNVKNVVTQENNQFSAGAKKCWNTHHAQKPFKINEGIYKYALRDRARKLQQVFKLANYYRPVDLLPWSNGEEQTNLQLFHTENVLDLGSVGKFLPPLLKEAYFLDTEVLPEVEDSNNHSNLPISQDENISEYIKSGKVDVAISISALKCIMDFNFQARTWIIPLVIKHVETLKGRKRVIFFDKPLAKITATNEDLNERCHKLLLRSNFCKFEGFKYSDNGKQVIEENEETIKDSKPNRTNHNVSYKLWTLKEEDNQGQIMMKTHKKISEFKMLVRTKLDGFQTVDNALQPVTIVPKLEYQANYGGRYSTRTEMVRSWTDMCFRPGSMLYNIRTHYKTSEVFKVDAHSSQRLLAEANRLYEFKAQHSLNVLHKLIIALSGHTRDGTYLLRHEAKNGPFVALLQQEEKESSFALDGFDLHEYYKNARVSDSYCKTWSQIDTNCVLPYHEQSGHCPGLFNPIDERLRNSERKKTKKKNAAKKKKVLKEKK